MNPDSFENKMEKFAGRLTTIVLLGFFSLLFSLPVITIGASFTALQKAMHAYVVKGNDKPLPVFFSAFKEYFPLSTKVFLLHLIVIAVLVWDYVYYTTGNSAIDFLGQFTAFMLLSVILLEMTMVFTVIALDMADSVKSAFAKAVDIGMICPLETLMLLGLFVAISIAVIFLLKGLILVLPGVIAYCDWQIIPNMLQKYKFKRGNLNYQKEKRNKARK